MAAPFGEIHLKKRACLRRLKGLLKQIRKKESATVALFTTMADFYPQWARTNTRSSAGNLTGTQATGANSDGLVGTVHDCLDLANVGLPGAIGLTVRVRDILTVNNTLSADTAFCHYLTPPYYGFGPVRL